MLDKLIDDARQMGLVGDISNMERGKTVETTAAIVTHLTIKQDGEVRHLVYKDFRSDWVGGGVAELRWYEQFATTMAYQVAPRFYGGAFDRAARRCYLFLEDVTLTHRRVPDEWPTETAPHTLLDDAVDSLARLHRCWWGREELDAALLVRGQGGPLRLAHATTPEVMGRYVGALQEALPGIWAEMGDVPAGAQSTCEQALNAWPRLLNARVADGQNLTLIHGDFHIWNVFFPHDPAQHAPLVLDWETYKRGLGVYDLAYLLITGLDVATRRGVEEGLLRRYYEGVFPAGASTYTWQQCRDDYRLAIIANLFPPLMWQNSEQVLKTLSAFEDWSCGALL